MNNYTTTSTGDYAVNPTKPSNTIKYKIKRSNIEEIVEQRKAEVTLHSSFLESIYDYTYLTYLNEEEIAQCALLVPKSQIAVGISI